MIIAIGQGALSNIVKNTKNIKVLFNSNVKKINETNGKISSITLEDNKEVNVKGVFIYIGYRPDTDNFKELNILNISLNNTVPEYVSFL